MTLAARHHTAGQKRPARSQQDVRLELRLRGRFLDERNDEYPMVTLAVSARSAVIRANHVPPEGAKIVCYLDSIGRVIGTVGNCQPKSFEITFETSQHKRDKLADQIIWLANKDKLGLSDDRQSRRYEADGPAQVRLHDGSILNCRVMDISLTGAGFEAIGRAPRIGDLIQVGMLRGEVVRSSGRSFGIRFLR